MTGQHSHTEDGMSVVQPQQEMAGDEFDLVTIVLQVARRKKLVAKVTLIFVVVGIIACFAWPVSYTSVVELMPPQQLPSAAMLMMNQLSGSASSLAAMSAGSVLGLKNPDDLYIDLLKSRPIADAIIAKFDLQKVYGSKDLTECRKALDAHTEVTSEKSGLMTITVVDKDKFRAAQIANMYTEQLRSLTQNLAVTEASRRAHFYESQLKDAGDSLADAERIFQQTQQNKGVIQPDAQAKAMIESLAQLRAKVASQEVAVQALKSFATENNPQLVIAENQLASLRGEVASLEQSSHSSGFSDLSLEQVPAAGLDYFRAQRNVLYRQALYDILLKQYEAAKLDEAKDAALIQVVEPAIPADRRSSPKTLMILVGAAAIGFFLGCLLALAKWWKDSTQADPEASKHFLELQEALTRWK